MLTIVPASKLPARVAVLLVFVLIPLRLWPQEIDWDKHMKAGEQAFQSLQFAKAEAEFEGALAQTKHFSDPDLRTAETLGKLANVYTREEKLAEAEGLLKRDAAATLAAVGPDDPRLANVLISMALNYDLQDEPDEAAPLWSRSVGTLEKASKAVDPGVLNAMDGVATRLKWRRSNPKGEEQIYTALLELRVSLGASDQDLRFVLNNLASLYGQTDRYAQAEPLLTRVLKLDEKEFGPDSSRVVSDLRGLADL